MSKQMIERYDMNIFEGKGSIKDRLSGFDIIEFMFPIRDRDMAIELGKLCMDYLEEHER